MQRFLLPQHFWLRRNFPQNKIYNHFRGLSGAVQSNLVRQSRNSGDFMDAISLGTWTKWGGKYGDEHGGSQSQPKYVPNPSSSVQQLIAELFPSLLE